jgi:CDP-diglyceride synthetase
MFTFIKRSFISAFLLTLTFFAYDNLFYYLLLISTTFVLSIKELLKINVYSYGLILSQVYLLYNFYSLEYFQIVVMVIVYNSVSDAIQYVFGWMFGKEQLFPFTSKTKEGYLAGIFVTLYIFNYMLGYPYFLVYYNILGMFGGMISSLMKRSTGIKHWSTLLGPHGGVNDRLDSIVLPLLILTSR